MADNLEEPNTDCHSNSVFEIEENNSGLFSACLIKTTSVEGFKEPSIGCMNTIKSSSMKPPETIIRKKNPLCQIRKRHKQISPLQSAAQYFNILNERSGQVSDEARHVARDSTLTNDALTVTEMAIIPEKYPETMLTNRHYCKIREMLFPLYETTSPYPEIKMSGVYNGIVCVTCMNSYSVQWLVQNIVNKSVKGIKLHTKNIPKPVKMLWKSIKITGIGLGRILRMLQNLNPTLNTSSWKVIRTTHYGLNVKRIVLVDPASAEVIRENGFCLRSCFEENYFKIIEDRQSVETEWQLHEPMSPALSMRTQDLLLEAMLELEADQQLTASQVKPVEEEVFDGVQEL